MNRFLLFTILFVVTHSTILFSADHQLTEVYSRGFGEPNDYKEGPAYPDVPLRWYVARFCTKEPVHALADYLKKIVDDGSTRIYLNCLSCGSGTAITFLYKTTHYKNDPDYFKGTNIGSEKDAQDIINAINKGGIRLDLPFLSVKKTVPVAVGSHILGLCTYVGVMYWLYRSGFAEHVFTTTGVKYNGLESVLSSMLATSIYYKFRLQLKNIYSTFLDILIVPCLTSFHYNPFHIKPGDAVEGLRDKFHCPVLIQCSSDDRLLENPDETTIQMYDAFRHNNQKNVYISLSNTHTHFNYFNDDKHEEIASIFEQCIHDRVSMPNVGDLQPTIEQLKKKIAEQPLIPWLWSKK